MNERHVDGFPHDTKIRVTGPDYRLQIDHNRSAKEVPLGTSGVVISAKRFNELIGRPGGWVDDSVYMFIELADGTPVFTTNKGKGLEVVTVEPLFTGDSGWRA